MTIDELPNCPDILVVDDVAANLDILAALLKEAGYAVRAAPTPELALQSARAHSPALLLLDVRMPGMDGFEVCRRLKEDARTREIPIIFVSGQNDLADRVRGFEVGGVDFISKPFQREEVLARVRLHLALRQAQNELELRVRKRTAELEASLRQLRETELAMDLVGIGIHWIDADSGRLLYVNDYFCQAHGYTHYELLGMTMPDLSPPPAGISFRQQLEPYRQAGQGRFETLHRHKDGRTIPVEITLYYRPSDDGRPGYFVAFMSDISLRKAAEDKMRRDGEQQLTLLHLLEATLRGDPLEDTLNRCLEQLLAISWLSILPQGAILLSDQDGQRLRLAVSCNLAPEIHALCAEIPYGHCLCGRAAVSGEILFASHVDERHETIYPGMHDHGHYCMPLKTNGRVEGVLALYLPKGTSPEPEKERFLASVADILAGYISRKAGEQALAEHQAHLETAIQERTADLKASEARTRAILTTMLDGVAHIDARGIILSVNYAVQEMFGYPADEMVGHNIAMLMPEPHATAHDGYLSRYLATRQPHIIGSRRAVTVLRKDGSLFPVELAVNEMTDDSGSTFIGVMRDMTTQLKAELEMKYALRAAQAATEAKSSFLANMSHEIRTPINAILGLARIGERDSEGRKSRETFSHLRDSGSHLLAVVNDILDFSKIEAGKMRVESRPFRLAAVIEDSVDMVAESARSKGLTLSVAGAGGVPEWVEGDPMRLKQILLNLLSNAIKFTERGLVTLKLGAEGENVLFQVTDTGIGMTEAQLARLFQSFEQADGSTTRKYGGTGLGLAISRNLAHLMGGDIQVASQAGRGSIFSLSLPLPSAAPGYEAAPEIPAGKHRLAGLRVLAADDVDLNRLILEDLLTHEGAHVVFANDGRQALERLEEAGASAFDVVLMDVQMPEMDGLEATRIIAAIAPGLPVIGLTAHAMEEERNKCFAAGMVDHVVKPVEVDTLVAAICRQVCLDTPAPIVPASTASQVPANGSQLVDCQDASVIDLAILSSRVGSDPAKIAKYAMLFIETARNTLTEMKAALAARDLPALSALGHRLKSAAFTVGAMRFGELCREMEGLKASDDLDAAQAGFEQLQALFERIEQCIKEPD